jgi:hypothetical protein
MFFPTGSQLFFSDIREATLAHRYWEYKQRVRLSAMAAGDDSSN